MDRERVSRRVPQRRGSAPQRKSQWGLLASLCMTVGLGGCSEPAPVKEAPSATTPGPTVAASGPSRSAPSNTTGTSPPKAPMNTATFEIRLTASGPTLTAVLHNASSGQRAVVIDSRLQPPELVLTGPGGAVQPFDTRSVQKFDNTVRKGSFTSVAAGADEPLGRASVQGSGGSASLQWGPYRFESLAAGTYTAKVVLKSVKDAYQDDQGNSVKVPDVWTGTVTSNEVSFQVP